MHPIPQKLREEIAESGQNSGCALDHGEYGYCYGRVEWHHVWTYAGRQIQEAWAIVGACRKHHDEVKARPEVKDALERESLRRATEKDLGKYPNKNWNAIRERLGKDKKDERNEPPF